MTRLKHKSDSPLNYGPNEQFKAKYQCNLLHIGFDHKHLIDQTKGQRYQILFSEHI